MDSDLMSRIDLRLDQMQDQLEKGLQRLEADFQGTKREVDQGMLALTELSHEVHGKLGGMNDSDSGLKQIQQELADQQDAMDALMDMLEKTITVEVSPAPPCYPPARVHTQWCASVAVRVVASQRPATS
jgi:uncharacterized phage infection (PIP) family protein YhgE